jgi:hypothetical protein
VFYLLFNAGMSYSMHFCGDEFKRINFFAESKTCCPSKEPIEGCCDDVSHLELPNTDQQLSYILDFQPIAVELLCALSFVFQAEWLEYVKELPLNYADSSPPPVGDTPLFVLHCIFLI